MPLIWLSNLDMGGSPQAGSGFTITVRRRRSLMIWLVATALTLIA